MSRGRDGSGNWNRSGRASGGARRAVIPVPGFKVDNDGVTHICNAVDGSLGCRACALGAPPNPTLGPMCLLGRHAGCAGNCVCPCHGPATREKP